jgi:hypothetical protein
VVSRRPQDYAGSRTISREEIPMTELTIEAFDAQLSMMFGIYRAGW